MKKILCLSMVMLLSACQPMVIPQTQIMQMGDARLCELQNSGGYYDDSTWQALQIEISGRHLNCDPDHLLCVSFGHREGTTPYAQCREQQYRLRVQQQEAEANRALMERMHREQLEAAERQRVDVYTHTDKPR